MPWLLSSDGESQNEQMRTYKRPPRRIDQKRSPASIRLWPCMDDFRKRYNSTTDPAARRAMRTELYALNDVEIWWRDRQKMIEDHGYMLRPRYHVGWVPSWSETWVSPERCEDSAGSILPAVLDAKRISDGTTVVLKRVSERQDEFEIAKFLTTPEMLQDERNHCIPILDDFADPSDGTRFIVMPLLRHFYEPEFECMDEVLDFMLQTMTAICFMHEKGIAHRDCALNNIMYDATRVFPEGHHFVLTGFNPSVRHLAKCVRRSSVLPVRYYLTDFGISTRFKDPSQPRRVVGIDCQDLDVPELSMDTPYDPFPVDIFTLGNLFKKCVLNSYENAEFLRPLILAMTQTDPEARPSAEDALKKFQDFVARETWYSRMWRLRRRNEGNVFRFKEDVRFVARDWIKLLKQFIYELTSR